MYPNQLPLSSITRGKNPRRFFDPAEMKEMEESVRSQGVIQPILVRPLNDGYELVAGGRRYTAAMAARGEDYEIPVMVREMTDAEAEEVALIENVQRANMSPAEEAEAAARILARCDGDRDETSKRLGWTRSTLDKRLALMNCVSTVRDALAERRIKLGHAELLATLAKERQEKALALVLQASPMPSVADLKAQIEQYANALSAAIFEKNDCAGCEYNSSNQQALFAESVAEGHCTNRDCWEQKTENALQGIKSELNEEFPEVRIVRPGENYSVIKLKVEGAQGVGDEQARSCRACKAYGAAISAVPGKVGSVYRDICFDAKCNEQKIQVHQKAILDEAKADEKVAESAGNDVASSKPEKKPAQSVQVQDSNRVKEYRVGIWRKALAKHLVHNPEQNERVLLALSLSGDARHISPEKLKQAAKALEIAELKASAPADMLDALSQASKEGLDKMRLLIAASAAENIEESRLVGLLKRLEVSLADHWQLNEQYLDLLTKSEIEVMAEQVGIKAHAGEGFTKLMSGKKGEIIKKMLALEGFEYAGKIPANMKFDQ